MNEKQFDKAIRRYTANQIVDALGCKRTTAYTWLTGERRPPDWQWALFVGIVEKHAKKGTK